MEHLPPKGVTPIIVAPYEAPEDEWYDGNKGFFLYPHHRRFEYNDAFREEGFRGMKGDSQKMEQFFQTWLYFGLVIEFMALAGIEVKTEDFLVQERKTKARLVTTKLLPNLLVHWQTAVSSSGKVGEIWKKASQMLECVRSALDLFYTPVNADRSPLLQEPPTWPVRDEIATTMMAMHFSLQEAAASACDKTDEFVNPSTWLTAKSGILTKRLQNMWCLADAAMFLQDLQIDGHYYFASSPAPGIEYKDNHYKCVPERCLFVVDIDLYATVHARAPWHQEPCKSEVTYGGQMGPERGQADWADAIRRILKNGATPLALWSRRYKNLWSVEYHTTGNRKPTYVAISHVWEDGMGNPMSNALPECQLERIQTLVERLQWKGRRPLPKDPNDSDGIGFWMDTLCIPVAEEDRKLRKQAIASMRHVYANAACVLVLDKWLQEISSTAPMLDIVTRLYQSNWIKRLWTHQEGFLAKLVYIQFSDKAVELNELLGQFRSFQKDLKAEGCFLRFPEAANLKLLVQYTNLKNIMQGASPWTLYLPLSDTMSERRTSRAQDEVICIATIIDMDLTPFQEISKGTDVEIADARMALFLHKLGKFNSGLIFNNYERHPIPGMGWAPRSLLNFRLPYRGYLEDKSTSTIRTIDGKEGLVVEYPGFVFKFSRGRPSFHTLERACAVTTPYDDYYLVELPPNKISWKTEVQYAVIVSRIPHWDDEPSVAVVGRCSAKPENGVYTFEHLCHATVRIPDEAPKWIDEVETPLLDDETTWLVV